jgi:dihydropyrimidine dehydrogenase (NAD+) subunit PreA
MTDLSVNIAGIRSPNPFWLASGPPTNTGEMIERAFDYGWGGAVWKTIGAQVQNVSSRLASIDYNGQRMVGLNNIELISDRSVEINLKEIREVKRRYPDRPLIISIMVESTREAWHDIIKRVEQTGADGVELNFGCPHGMNERGMGSAMGQVPEYTQMVTEWVREVATIPVFVKLTPNVTNILNPARAAVRGGAHALSLINTINSIMGVDLETMIPYPNVNGMASHGGYCGPAVKPVALHMLTQISNDTECKVPVSGIGGISTWRDAAEFMLLGSTTVQVCTAVMHYGYRIIEDLTDGLTEYVREKGLGSASELIGLSAQRVTEWGNLDLNYKTVARIDHSKCIKCNLCYVACHDGAHQCIDINEKLLPVVDEPECIGCNLCQLVCPSPGCISMIRTDNSTRPMSWRDLQEAKSTT